MTPIPLTDTSRPPQFPCWVWDRELQFWRHSDAEFFELCNDPSDTHWHPDQPEAPTEVPETNPKAESQNPKGDTPRTDAARGFHDMDTAVDAEEMAKLEQELVEARAYADKLAAGLPDGLLPADVDNLRKANGELAQELAEMTEDRDKLLAELAATKAALEAQADYQRELRADRDRLDWLDDNTRGFVTDANGGAHLAWRFGAAKPEKALRENIDAAMQKQEGGK